MHAVRLGWLAAPRPGLRCTRHANRETQASFAAPLFYLARFNLQVLSTMRVRHAGDCWKSVFEFEKKSNDDEDNSLTNLRAVKL
jgi:hypothetical protein